MEKTGRRGGVTKKRKIVRDKGRGKEEEGDEFALLIRFLQVPTWT